VTRPVLLQLLSLLLLPLRWCTLQGMLVVLGVASALWNVIALVLLLLLPRAVGRRVGRGAIAHGYALYWLLARASGLMRMDASALDVLADEPGGLVVVANHPSMLDALLLVARLPRSACVMKASLMHNPLLGPGARLARYIRNDSARVMVRLAVNDLQAGGQLIMFPEGTRTTQAPLNRFRPGFTLIAKLAQVPIQTVIIETNSPYLGKGWPLWKLPPLPIRFSVRLGQRFRPQRDAGAQLREIEAYFVQEMLTPKPTAQGAAAAP
jgi:1-acyl-sn-glycerol-3-phosphate acyltransferase